MTPSVTRARPVNRFNDADMCFTVPLTGNLPRSHPQLGLVVGGYRRAFGTIKKMTNQPDEPRRTIDAGDQPVTFKEAFQEAAKFTWAKPTAAVSTTFGVATVFSICVAVVHSIDRRLVDVLAAMGGHPLPVWVAKAALVGFIAAAALFAVQVRHHHGASDPASMLTGATEDVIGRWPGLRLTTIAVAAIISASVLMAWSSLV